MSATALGRSRIVIDGSPRGGMPLAVTAHRPCARHLGPRRRAGRSQRCGLTRDYPARMRDDLVQARRFAITSGVMAAGFGLPLFLDPFRWAGWFGWPQEPQTNVGRYFGRCLGAL